MTLLEVVTRAVAAADAGTLASRTKHLFVIDSDTIILNLKPSSGSECSAASSIVQRLEGWVLPQSDLDIADHAAKISNKLRRRLKNPRSQDRGEFLELLQPFLKKILARVCLSTPPDLSGVDFVCSALSKLGFYVGEELLCLILEVCVAGEIWEVIETLISEKLVGNLNSFCLIDRLIEKNHAELICLFARETPSLRLSEIVSFLKFFISPSRDALESMIPVRKKWEDEAVVAIEKATRKGLDRKISKVAKEAAILLMIAHDGFSTPELCLHFLFGSSNLDGFVLSSAISRLDGSEMIALLRYFTKWLRKYRDFPEAVPCPSASSLIGLRNTKFVPSLNSIATAMALVLNEHFPRLVLNSTFHNELKEMEDIAKSLAFEAEICFSVADIVKNWQA